jgi:hypothetical protein
MKPFHTMDSMKLLGRKQMRKNWLKWQISLVSLAGIGIFSVIYWIIKGLW